MELFVSFREIMQFFKRHLRQFLLVIALFGIVFGLLPLRFYQHEYNASTTILITCEIPEDASTDYRLQYTNILYTRVNSAIAMANGTDLIHETAQKLGMKDDKINNIGAVQVNGAPMVKITVTSSDANQVSNISDAVAQELGDKLEASFPSPKITVSISDKAVPQKPQSNKSTMVKSGLLGLIAGFLLYICYGIIVVLTDKTIRNNDFISEALNISFLGPIFKYGTEEKKLNSYRKLRAAAVHQAGEGKTFLVTNVCLNNGSSEVTVGLGNAIARSEKNVLLIDADVRAHKIARFLGVKPVHNLTDILDGTCSADDTVTATSMNGLSLIAGSDRSADDLSDIMATDKFKKLLEVLSPKYDYIVVNVPSEVQFPDADNLAALFDAVIMVAKNGSTPYHEFKDSFRRLKTSGANLIGFVTTDC